MMRSTIVRGALAALALGASLSAAAAQSPAAWPTRSLQVISPFTAGNANDIVARIVLEQVQKQVGQSFVIENRPGGGGMLGAAAVAKADPDGYTLLLFSSSIPSQVILHKSLPFDPLKDFAPAALFGVQPSVLVSSPARGFKTVADLVNAAKAKPGALNFASAGVGAASHLAAERFRLAAKLDVQHIPFRGPVEAFTEVRAGRIDYYFVPITPAMPVIRENQVTALAVSTPMRAPALPDVPTIVEAGYPDATYLFWGGIAFPAKTPRAIVEKLNEEVTKALQVRSVQDKLADIGVQLQPMGVDAFAKFFHEDMAATIKLAKDINLAPTN